LVAPPVIRYPPSSIDWYCYCY